MPSALHIDFSSAIDNARFFAAREEAQRRNSGHSGIAQAKAGRPARGDRPAARSHLSVTPKLNSSSHAH
jgi:hypothetical protein